MHQVTIPILFGQFVLLDDMSLQHNASLPTGNFRSNHHPLITHPLTNACDAII